MSMVLCGSAHLGFPVPGQLVNYLISGRIIMIMLHSVGVMLNWHWATRCMNINGTDHGFALR